MKDLKQRWIEFWERVKAKGDPKLVYAELVKSYCDPVMAYHNLDHISRCLDEFEQAKHIMQTLAKEIMKVTYNPDLTGYISTGFRTSLPQFIETGETLKVWINGDLEQEIPINLLVIQGGNTVDDVYTVIVGEDKTFLRNYSTPLYKIYVERSEFQDILREVRRPYVESYLALLGSRQTGKTTLLYRVYRELRREGEPVGCLNCGTEYRCCR